MLPRLFTRGKPTLPLYIIVGFAFCVVYYYAHKNSSGRQTRSADGDGESEIMKYRQERYRKHQQRGNVDGPGEKGMAVHLNAEDQKKADSLFKKEAFNIIASDKVAMDRSVHDTRDPGCKLVEYPKDLPTASVIIIFHNEAWTPLLRTAHSVVNRSPPEYLHEVILLDDFSDREGLGEELEKYVSETWPDGVVRIVRTKERSGIIRARMAGARAATGDVIIVLDSHCEANVGWLEPLLARIKEKRTAILCPEIDIISAQNLHYSGVGGTSVGGFWWSLHFSWHGMPAHERSRRKAGTDPVRSPTMAGGLFAADRKYFFEIGGYDEGMDIWGGENLEISFRVWMCGGSLEFIPCSRVGHIFRASHPYTFPGNKDTHGLNSKRLADVWMDEYKRLFYTHRRELINADAGDITERVELRKRLNCKSFKWYLDNIYPEKFIPDENVQGWGMVRNPATSKCLDTMGKDEKTTFQIEVFSCQSGTSASEVFSLSMKGELRREEGCLDATGAEGAAVNLMPCHGLKGNQEWKYDKVSKQILHVQSGKCFTVQRKGAEMKVMISACKNDDELQKWEIEHIME